jgi:hypothetical protein
MNAERPTRMAFLAGSTLLVLALAIAGFAVGRSLRTSKAQAREAGSVAMASAFDSSFRSAYRAGSRSGFTRGQPEGEALGTQRASARGRRYGERVRERRLLRRALRRRIRARHVAHQPQVSAPVERGAPHRRRPHRIQRHGPRRPRREAAAPEREPLGEGRERRSPEATEGEGELR